MLLIPFEFDGRKFFSYLKSGMSFTIKFNCCFFCPCPSMKVGNDNEMIKCDVMILPTIRVALPR